ncbi:hypothetical protein DYB28_004288, partial [Aphanomyces astaci]
SSAVDDAHEDVRRRTARERIARENMAKIHEIASRQRAHAEKVQRHKLERDERERQHRDAMARAVEARREHTTVSPTSVAPVQVHESMLHHSRLHAMTHTTSSSVTRNRIVRHNVHHAAAMDAWNEGRRKRHEVDQATHAKFMAAEAQTADARDRGAAAERQMVDDLDAKTTLQWLQDADRVYTQQTAARQRDLRYVMHRSARERQTLERATEAAFEATFSRSGFEGEAAPSPPSQPSTRVRNVNQDGQLEDVDEDAADGQAPRRQRSLPPPALVCRTDKEAKWDAADVRLSITFDTAASSVVPALRDDFCHTSNAHTSHLRRGSASWHGDHELHAAASSSDDGDNADDDTDLPCFDLNSSTYSSEGYAWDPHAPASPLQPPRHQSESASTLTFPPAFHPTVRALRRMSSLSNSSSSSSSLSSSSSTVFSATARLPQSSSALERDRQRLQDLLGSSSSSSSSSSAYSTKEQHDAMQYAVGRMRQSVHDLSNMSTSLVHTSSSSPPTRQTSTRDVANEEEEDMDVVPITREENDPSVVRGHQRERNSDDNPPDSMMVDWKTATTAPLINMDLSMASSVAPSSPMSSSLSSWSSWKKTSVRLASQHSFVHDDDHPSHDIMADAPLVLQWLQHSPSSSSNPRAENRYDCLAVRQYPPIFGDDDMPVGADDLHRRHATETSSGAHDQPHHLDDVHTSHHGVTTTLDIHHFNFEEDDDESLEGKRSLHTSQMSSSSSSSVADLARSIVDGRRLSRIENHNAVPMSAQTAVQVMVEDDAQSLLSIQSMQSSSHGHSSSMSLDDTSTLVRQSLGADASSSPSVRSPSAESTNPAMSLNHPPLPSPARPPPRVTEPDDPFPNNAPSSSSASSGGHVNVTEDVVLVALGSTSLPLPSSSSLPHRGNEGALSTIIPQQPPQQATTTTHDVSAIYGSAWKVQFGAARTHNPPKDTIQGGVMLTTTHSSSSPAVDASSIGATAMESVRMRPMGLYERGDTGDDSTCEPYWSMSYRGGGRGMPELLPPMPFPFPMDMSVPPPPPPLEPSSFVYVGPNTNNDDEEDDMSSSPEPVSIADHLRLRNPALYHRMSQRKVPRPTPSRVREGRDVISPAEMKARNQRLYEKLPEVVEQKRQDEIARQRIDRLRKLREDDKARRHAARRATHR